MSPEAAVDCIARGELIGFPTETSWGLGADAASEKAMSALRGFKCRDADKPVSVLVSGAAALGALDVELTEAAAAIVGALWPGPITLVLPCRDRFARGVANADGGVGFRCSTHPVAGALSLLAESAGTGPLTATSLNASGEPDCLDRQAARRCAGDDVQLVAGPDAFAAPPSTVVDATGPAIRILREGAVPRATLERILAGEPAA